MDVSGAVIQAMEERLASAGEDAEARVFFVSPLVVQVTFRTGDGTILQRTEHEIPWALDGASETELKAFGRGLAESALRWLAGGDA